MENTNESMGQFVAETPFVDYHSTPVRFLTKHLGQANSKVSAARRAYEFVRDEIPHSFDIDAAVITASASEVAQYRTGICHAKANLLAALLRVQGIPTGFCFQLVTRGEDDSQGLCLHAYNAVYLEGNWAYLDARGNRSGIDAQFSLSTPKLAFANRPEFGERFIEGIFAEPDVGAMSVLKDASSLAEVLARLPAGVRVST
jgi:transglutaminase-like putative cysteine protease